MNQYSSHSGSPPPRSNSGPPNKKSRGDYSFDDQNYDYVGNQNLQDFLERKDEKLPPNHILLITVLNAKYPINVEVIYKVCNIVGKIKRIVCFERNTVVQAMVEFDTLENASKARTSLHGCDIYNNCCTMKVEYSKMENLRVRENGPMSWDFTVGKMEREERRPVILNEPEMGGGVAMGENGRGADFMGGMRSMDMMGSMGEGRGQPFGHGPSMERMMGGGGDRGGWERSCVVVVHNLAQGEVNCDRLFNLVCQYGNVSKIFFMKTKPGCAMVEMSDHDGAQRAVANLQSAVLFGNKVQLDISKKHIRITNAPLEFELPDGSSSVKDYFGNNRLNRFNTPEMAKKNRILAPTKVVHFYGIPKVSDQEIEDLFTEYAAPRPNKIKWVESKRGDGGNPPAREDDRSGVGLAYFDTSEEATEALVLVNHRELEGKTIKLCFSPATY